MVYNNYNLLLKVSLVIIIIYLTRVNQSAKAVINGCSGQLKIKILKEKTTITYQLSENVKTMYKMLMAKN